MTISQGKQIKVIKVHSVVSYFLSKLIQHPVHSVIFKRFPSADKVMNTNEILLGKVLNVREIYGMVKKCSNRMCNWIQWCRLNITCPRWSNNLFELISSYENVSGGKKEETL